VKQSQTEIKHYLEIKVRSSGNFTWLSHRCHQICKDQLTHYVYNNSSCNYHAVIIAHVLHEYS